jgi:NADH:ubiquinone oxidoreductase subunit E
MCENALTEGKFKELDSYVDALPEKHGMLISVLHKAQAIFGYLPQEVQLHVARKLDLPAAKVYGVVSFYSYFAEEPRGDHIINVCTGTACFVRGAEGILKELESHLGIKSGQTTPDGRFTIDALRCVGACGLAPVVMVDGKVYGRVKTGEVTGIVKEYAEV